MYYLSILAMFKNESMIIEEWIQHYLQEGVEHFYFIDNGSNDHYETCIQKYASYYTLVKDDTRLKHGTQTYLCNKIYLEKVKKETKWLIVCDIDEYIYARLGYQKIPDVLKVLPGHVEKIWLAWKSFGSSGLEKQPKSVIASFLKRGNIFENKKGEGKIIIQTKNLVSIVACGHRAELTQNDVYYTCNGNLLSSFDLDEKNYATLRLHNNHYRIMSYEYIRDVKSVRGGGEFGKNGRYKISYLQKLDQNYNKKEDKELFEKKQLKIEVSSEWYAFKKHFRKHNQTITSKVSTFLKTSMCHSSTLHETQKKEIKANVSFSLLKENDNYYIINIV